MKKLSLYSNKLHISVTISRSSVLSTNVLLTFNINDLNGALFLKASYLFLLLLTVASVTLFDPFITIYASL